MARCRLMIAGRPLVFCFPGDRLPMNTAIMVFIGLPFEFLLPFGNDEAAIISLP